MSLKSSESELKSSESKYFSILANEEGSGWSECESTLVLSVISALETDVCWVYFFVFGCSSSPSFSPLFQIEEETYFLFIPWDLWNCALSQ